MSHALDINSVSVSYRSAWTGKKFPAISNITLQIPTGQAVGYLGQNGAGKTSTIKCILDLVHVEQGTISIFGKSSSLPEARRLVGYLPEQPYWYENITVEETLLFYGAMYGLTRQDTLVAMNPWLERLELASKRTAKMKMLSKGLMQRVGLIQTVLHNPSLLILDEPFSGLDPLGRKLFRDIFIEQKKSGVTIFISSHILSDIEVLCDRAVIIHNKKIAKDMQLEELSSYTEHTFRVEIQSTENRSLTWPETLQPYISVKDKDSVTLELPCERMVRAAIEFAYAQNAAVTRVEPIAITLEAIFATVAKGVSS